MGFSEVQSAQRKTWQRGAATGHNQYPVSKWAGLTLTFPHPFTVPDGVPFGLSRNLS